MISALSNESQKRDGPSFRERYKLESKCKLVVPIYPAVRRARGGSSEAVCNLTSGRQSESTHIEAYLLNLAACDILRL